MRRSFHRSSRGACVFHGFDTHNEYGVQNYEITVDNPVEFLKTLFFNAYNASRCVGMGFMQAIENATKQQVFDCVKPDREGEPYHADYVFGRMMKLTARVNGNEITLSDETPLSDYQSWCRTYPTYGDLAASAMSPQVTTI